MRAIPRFLRACASRRSVPGAAMGRARDLPDLGPAARRAPEHPRGAGSRPPNRSARSAAGPWSSAAPTTRRAAPPGAGSRPAGSWAGRGGDTWRRIDERQDASPPAVRRPRPAPDGVEPPPAPGPGEVRIRIRAVGLNFIDVWGFRGMAFAKRKMPLIVGAEAAGRRRVGRARASPTSPPATGSCPTGR